MANQCESGKKHVSTKKCSFSGCSRTKSKFPSLHFFKFPVNRPDISSQWIINCANESLTSLPSKTLQGKLVCEKHFSEDSFTNLMKTRLKKNSVPTLLSLIEEELDLSSSPARLPATSKFQQGEKYLFESGVASLQSSTPPAQASVQISNSNITTIKTKVVRKSLFSTSPKGKPSAQSPSPIKTPLYKKFKSVKGRKATPRKVVTPGKRKLILQLCTATRLKKKFQIAAKRLSIKKPRLTKQDLISNIETHLPKNVSKFFSMQINHANHTKKPWTEEEKRQALTFFYKSPTMYDKMKQDGFAFPSRSTLSRWLEAVDIRPGLCPGVLNFIRTKVDCMSVWKKKCLIMFDEMTIKNNLEYDSKQDLIEGIQDFGELGRQPTPGTKVLLFMARGLIHKWKVPLAYFVIGSSINSGPLSTVIQQCVSAAQKTGLDVKGVVCDQSSTNRRAAKLLGVSTNQPYFENGKKNIIWLYDFPHVIKCVRNNLMKKSRTGQLVGQILTNKGTADWSHLVTLYNLDKGAKARATKLTEKHICPNSFEKMSVKLATQVFSHTVSTAMQTAVDLNQIVGSATETATFLAEMNNIFDAMNSKTKFHPNPHKCGLMESENIHLRTPLDTIRKGIEWVKTWVMSTTLTRPPSFDGMEHSMSAVPLLWEDLRKENVSYLLTGRLNQDPLENEFSIARQRGGYNRNPRATSFRLNIRHRIQGALIQPPSGTNCEPDEDYILSNPSHHVSPSQSLPLAKDVRDVTDSVSESECEYEQSDDESDVDIPSASSQSLESSAIRYFAGYAIRACLNKFKCKTCEQELTKQASYTSPDEILIKNRRYVSPAGEVCDSLIRPSDNATRVADIALSVFEKSFPKKMHAVGLKRNMILKTKQLLNKEVGGSLAFNDCKEHLHFVINKIITAKIKRAVQDISKDLRQPRNKQGRFTQKIKNLKNI